MYKKFLYPIVKCKKLKSWIKYYILSIPEKAKEVWSEILTGTSFTLENSLESVFNKFDLKGNTAQATSILPTGYTQLDYIESSGTQSIGTSISGSGTWKLKIQGTSNTGSTQIILGRASSRGHWFGISSGGKYTLGGGIDTTKNYNELVEANVTVTNTGISLTIGNETVTRDNEYLVTNAYNLIGLDSYLSHIKMYRASFYQNNVLKNDLIPCKNSSNVIGMYDIVTNTFYQNAGTGTFTAGNTVTIPNPDYPQTIHTVNGNNNIKIENKNLFDKSMTRNARWQLTEEVYQNGLKLTSTANSGVCYVSYKFPFDYNETKNLYVSFDKTGTGFVNIYFYDKNNNEVKSEPNHQSSFAVSSIPTTAVNCVIYFYGSTANTGDVTIFDNIQLEFGTSSTTYTAHAEQNLPVNLASKNLFDYQAVTNTGIIDDNGTIGTQTTRLFSNKIKVIPSTIYHFKTIAKSSNNEDIVNNRLIYYDSNGSFLRRDYTYSLQNDFSFTVPSDVYYIVIDLGTQALTTTLTASLLNGNTQLELRKYSNNIRTIL